MSIRDKILLYIISTTLVFAITAVTIFSNSERSNLLILLEKKSATYEKLLKKSTTSLLFDMNKDVIAVQLELLFQDIDIVQIELIDYSKVIDFRLKKKNYDKNNLLISSMLLEKDRKELGFLNIYYTKQNIEVALKNFNKNIIFISILFVSFFLIFIFYFMNKTVKSLKILSTATKRISNGELDFNINISNTNDEISELAKNFKVMIDTIKTNNNKIEKQLKFQSILIESINIPVYIKSVEGIYLNCNSSFAKIFGKTKDEILGKDISFLFNGKRLEEQKSSEKKLVEDGGSITYENSFQNAKGELRDLIQFKTTYQEGNKVKWVIGTYIDVTERNSAKKKIGIFSQAIKQSPVSIIITDTNANIEYVNEYFEKVSGFSLEEVKGRKPKFLQSNIVSTKKYNDIWDSINTRGVWEGEIQIRKKNGELYWEHVYFSTILNESNNLINYLAVKENITLRKEQEKKLEYQAHFDTLTNLPNRVLFNDRVRQLLKEYKRGEKIFAILFIDLDNFKKVNDTLGHLMGDELLVKVAKRFSSTLREEDTISRFGGDEFTILLPDISTIDNISKIADKVLASFQKPFMLDNHKLIMTTSIGIVTNLDFVGNVEDLLKNADIAMYKSKENGKNSYVYFNETLNKELLKKIQIEQNMDDGLQNDEFEVYFQSKIDLNTSKVISAEALLRWNSPLFDFISPEEFIPVAEQTGLIIPIGEFVIKKSIELIVKLKKEFEFDFKIAVNVSPKQLLNKSFLSFIKNELISNQVNPEYLEIEITEGVLIDKSEEVSHKLNDLKKMGISLSLDDFGTGYSSLSYLRKYSFDIIKIDKSFIDAQDYNLVKTIISMSHSMNLKVIAEGIETKEQLLKLQELNCDMGQGYYFSKPIPRNSFLKYLKDNISLTEKRTL